MIFMEVGISDIKKDLDFLKKIVLEMRAKMIDPDSIMDEDDFAALATAREEKINRKLVSFEDLKKDLGI